MGKVIIGRINTDQRIGLSLSWLGKPAFLPQACSKGFLMLTGHVRKYSPILPVCHAITTNTLGISLYSSYICTLPIETV